MKTLLIALLLTPALAVAGGVYTVDISPEEFEELTTADDVYIMVEDAGSGTGTITSVGLIETCDQEELLESMKFLLDYAGMYPEYNIVSTTLEVRYPKNKAERLIDDAEYSKELAEQLYKARRVYEECK